MHRIRYRDQSNRDQSNFFSTVKLQVFLFYFIEIVEVGFFLTIDYSNCEMFQLMIVV